MRVTICDLCAETITGKPQGKGNPALAKNVVFFHGPIDPATLNSNPADTFSAPSDTYETCWSCFDEIHAYTKGLRND